MSKYLSKHPPPKARELASELGVSIKTVYKALYKYRRLYGRSLSSTEDPSSGSSEVLVKVAEEADALLEAMYELKMSIDRLNETLNRLLTVLPSASMVQQDSREFVELPHFVKDNPWLRIIVNRSEG